MGAALRCQEELLALNDDFARNGLPRLGVASASTARSSSATSVRGSGSSTRSSATPSTWPRAWRGSTSSTGRRSSAATSPATWPPGKSLLRRLDRVRVKGKHNPEEIFEVVAVKGPIRPALPERLRGPFEKGCSSFSGDFAAALEIFAARADDPPTQVFRSAASGFWTIRPNTGTAAGRSRKSRCKF